MSSSSSLSFDEIMAIEEAGEVDTYDFVIPDGHSFFANGILVHNSGTLEEDADIILLLHRPELYIPPTEREASGKAGLLEVKIAGHRQLGLDDKLDLYWQPERYCYGVQTQQSPPPGLPIFGG